ncbi:MAG: hypothetical protein AAGC70_02625 [Pseudomonadota bacterium]
MRVPEQLRHHHPRDLSHARAIAHQAVQFPYRAARENLAPQADYSHTSLMWSRLNDAFGNAFLSQAIPVGTGEIHVGVSLVPLRLLLVQQNHVNQALDLTGTTVDAAANWLDAELAKLGLKPGGLPQPADDLPIGVAAVTDFESAVSGELETLSAWFGLTHDVLSDFAARNDGITPGPSPVRCWPHHFDMATYVALEAGDPETANGVGLGLSPGDESYDQPYLYINPWPHLPTECLPDLPSPGHWHMHGFVGAVATGEAILAAPEPVDLADYVDQVFAESRRLLGA